MPSFLHSLISRVLGLDGEEIHDAARLLDDFGVDAFDRTELLVELEAQLDIHVPDRELESVFTIGDVVRVVNRALVAKRDGPPGALRRPRSMRP